MSTEYNLKTILSHLRDIRQITSDGTKLSSDFSAGERSDLLFHFHQIGVSAVKIQDWKPKTSDNTGFLGRMQAFHPTTLTDAVFTNSYIDRNIAWILESEVESTLSGLAGERNIEFRFIYDEQKSLYAAKDSSIRAMVTKSYYFLAVVSFVAIGAVFSLRDLSLWFMLPALFLIVGALPFSRGGLLKIPLQTSAVDFSGESGTTYYELLVNSITAVNRDLEILKNSYDNLDRCMKFSKIWLVCWIVAAIVASTVIITAILTV